jgi:hypothetical protein
MWKHSAPWSEPRCHCQPCMSSLSLSHFHTYRGVAQRLCSPNASHYLHPCKKAASSVFTRHHKKVIFFLLLPANPVSTRRACQGSGSAHRNVMEMESVWLILFVFLVWENSWWPSLQFMATLVKRGNKILRRICRCRHLPKSHLLFWHQVIKHLFFSFTSTRDQLF